MASTPHRGDPTVQLLTRIAATFSGVAGDHAASQLGHLLLEAGKSGEALPHLERAAHSEFKAIAAPASLAAGRAHLTQVGTGSSDAVALAKARNAFRLADRMATDIGMWSIAEQARAEGYAAAPRATPAPQTENIQGRRQPRGAPAKPDRTL